MALAALLLVLLAAPAVGWTTGSLADEAFRRSAVTQQKQRHLTAAVVVRTASGASRFAQDPDSAVTEEPLRRSVLARWAAPDGTPRTATVWTASSKSAPGTLIRIWTDQRGMPVTRPMDTSTAHTHAVLAGIGAALLAVGATEAARRIVVWRMRQQRYARIDRAWAEVGPDWGRTGTGS